MHTPTCTNQDKHNVRVATKSNLGSKLDIMLL